MCNNIHLHMLLFPVSVPKFEFFIFHIKNLEAFGISLGYPQFCHEDQSFGFHISGLLHNPAEHVLIKTLQSFRRLWLWD